MDKAAAQKLQRYGKHCETQIFQQRALCLLIKNILNHIEEAEINRLVHGLCGLTTEDIAAVEGR